MLEFGHTHVKFGAKKSPGSTKLVGPKRLRQSEGLGCTCARSCAFRAIRSSLSKSCMVPGIPASCCIRAPWLFVAASTASPCAIASLSSGRSSLMKVAVQAHRGVIHRTRLRPQGRARKSQGGSALQAERIKRAQQLGGILKGPRHAGKWEQMPPGGGDRQTQDLCNRDPARLSTRATAFPQHSFIIYQTSALAAWKLSFGAVAHPATALVSFSLAVVTADEEIKLTAPNCGPVRAKTSNTPRTPPPKRAALFVPAMMDLSLRIS